MTKKTEKKNNKEKTNNFDVFAAIDKAQINPLLVTGFKYFILTKKVTTQKEFDKLLKEYIEVTV